MTEYIAGRAQMGMSLGFHIVFASLGVGLPLLLLVVEGMGLRTGDREWRLLARCWSKAFGILFAVGAVSGTVLSFELGLLWPGFMGYAGGIIGLPFSMEGFAFFLEAIFLGLYLYGLLVGMILGSLCAPLQVLTGDINARWVADHQPAKLAAMEGEFKTEAGAPLRIGGLPDLAAHVTRYAIEIPGGLSFLAYGDANATVRGLDSFIPGSTPDPRPVHLAFDLMVGIGFALLGLAGWFFALLWRRRQVPQHRLLLQAVAAGGILSFVAIEMGWMVTEIGRQPWIIYGVLRTAAAITPAPGLVVSFWVSAAIYVALTVACVILLLRLADGTRAGGEPDFAEEGAFGEEGA